MSVKQLDERVESIDGIDYRYSSAWIHKLEDEQHWRLYWRQQHLMKDLISAGDHVLEIGLGSGFTRNYLQSKGIRVTTLDLDEAKKPDILANIVSYPFVEQYDAVLAFEVFEHIPFDKFCEVVARISKSCRKGFYFSVPRNVKTPFQLTIKLPCLKPRRFSWSMKRGRLSSDHHHWEIDYNDVTFDRLTSVLRDAGLLVQRSEEAFHHVFFACSPVAGRPAT
jgi:Methyltransferase domain